MGEESDNKGIAHCREALGQWEEQGMLRWRVQGDQGKPRCQ